MPAFLKGSLIVNLIVSVCRAFAISYKNSRFSRFVKACGVCWKQSLVHRLIGKYFYKPAYFEYSLTYRFILWLVKIIDVPVSLIGRFVRYLISGSKAFESVNALTEASTRDRLITGSTIGIFISVGYAVGMVIKGQGAASAASPVAVTVLCIVVWLAALKLNWIKNSAVYKFLAWLGWVKK
jgi:hypothetical protein